MNRSPFATESGKRLILLPLFFLLVCARAVHGQETQREHFQIKVGTAYDRGDYGTSELTKTRYFPITFRYLGEKFDASVTPSVARTDSSGGVVLIDGVPTPIGPGTGALQQTQYGAG